MSRSNKLLSAFSTLGELCLATLSFLFFKAVKFLIRRLLSVHYVIAKRQAFQWKFATSELLNRPGTLPMIMTMGPRCNTHAIIANAGPLTVKRSLGVHVAAAESSAQVWTLVVSTFPGFKTVTAIGSTQAPFKSPSAELPVGPGKYWVALRYYGWGESVDLPALTVDGEEVVRSTRVPPDLNDFYRALPARNNLFYLCLNYYVFVLLCYRRYFPAAFVESEFLPMANPDTQFYFGAMRTGERLLMKLDPSLLSSYDVYLTIYDIASFPVAWFRVSTPEFTIAESGDNRTYLVRIHNKNKGSVQKEFPSEKVGISVINLCAPQN